MQTYIFRLIETSIGIHCIVLMMMMIIIIIIIMMIHDDNHDEHDESEHDEHGDLLKVEEFQFAEWGFTSSPGGHERIAVEECPVIPAMFRCWKIQL